MKAGLMMMLSVNEQWKSSADTRARVSCQCMQVCTLGSAFLHNRKLSCWWACTAGVYLRTLTDCPDCTCTLKTVIQGEHSAIKRNVSSIDRLMHTSTLPILIWTFHEGTYLSSYCKNRDRSFKLSAASMLLSQLGKLPLHQPKTFTATFCCMWLFPTTTVQDLRGCVCV